MNTTKSNLTEVALHDYEVAREELNRPEHDVVTHSVCQLTRKSITSMLRAYLDANGMHFNDSDTLEKLVQQSKNFNPSLADLNFDVLACSHLSLEANPVNYCLSEARVHHCFQLLESLKATLLVN